MRLKTTTAVLLTIFFIAPVFADLEYQRVYAVDLEYNNGSLKSLNVSMVSGFPSLSEDKAKLFPPPNKDENFSISMPICKVELLSKNQELLYQGYFFVPNEITSVVPPLPGESGQPPFPPGVGQGEKPGPTELENVNFSISLPYSKNGQTIRITKDEHELLSIDVSRFQMYCGDGRCQYDENIQSCPADCEISAPAQPPGGPTQQQAKGVFTNLMYAGIAIALIILGALVIHKLTKKE
jgi:hypothetical protein